MGRGQMAGWQRHRERGIARDRATPTFGNNRRDESMSEQVPHSNRGDEQRKLTLGIMIAVAVWGLLLALGAALFGLDPESGTVRLSLNPLRGLIVLACVGGFLAFWAAMLRLRASRVERAGRHSADKGSHE